MKKIILLAVLPILFSCENDKSKDLLFVDGKPSVQEFRVEPGRDTVIVGKEGTFIKFRKDSFVDSTGKTITEPVKIELSEFYTTQDFIRNRLSTNTVDKKILKSSGMVLIQASYKGASLSLKADNPMNIMFRKIQTSKQANLFSGKRAENDEVRWSLLEPTHNDTIVIRKETIVPKGYGMDEIFITIQFLIAGDTINLHDVEMEGFEKVLARYEASTIFYSTSESAVDTVYGVDSTTAGVGYVYNPDRYYAFETTSLGYLNCDIFIDDDLYQLFTVKSNRAESDVFIVMTNLKSLVYPDSTSPDGKEYIFTIPRNEPLTVVTYSENNGDHYYAIENVPAGRDNVLVEQKKQELEKIKQKIKEIE